MLVVMSMHPYLMAMAHPVVMGPHAVAPIYPMGLGGRDRGRETPYGEPKD
jgi:hypothetical protein